MAISEKIIVGAQKVYLVPTLQHFSFPRSRVFSFPRSSVGMHAVWVPTPERGNQTALRQCGTEISHAPAFLVPTLQRGNACQTDFLPGKRFFVCLALVLLAVTFAVSGCGKKGPPQPDKLSMPTAVSGLAATVDGKNITLRWNIPESEKKKPTGFFIYRGYAACATCPVKFAPVARLPYRSEPVFTFTDTPGGPGHYTYKIRCVDAYGIQGPIAIADAVLPEEAK